MSNEIQLYPRDLVGRGGGGSKSSSSGSEANNTLRSNSYARLVELISEGPIEGVVNGGKGIYFNNTPIVNGNGTVNYMGVQWETRVGLPDQGVLFGNATASNITSVGVQVQKSVEPTVRTIDDADATSCSVIVRIPSLNKINTTTGAITATSVSWVVECLPNGWTQWAEMARVDIINQKCNSLYEQESKFSLPSGGYPWQVRVRRLTDDSTTVDLSNQTWWESYTSIVEGQFTYPNSALVAIEINADLFAQSSIPSRTFLVKGLLLHIPSNYDPIARTYNGIWDGTFKVAWSNNPAWVFYDLITNDRYGLGEFVDAVTIDKWSLYSIAQYCDQYVPDGFGGTEPRYVFNGVLNSRSEAYKVLQQITTSFRGMAYWSLGQVFATCDMPQDPVKLVSPANVIGGHFSYSGTALKTRHSVAIVTWSDPSNFYTRALEVVVNDTLLQQYGWRETSTTAIGCTSRGAAHRFGKWLLDTEQHATETIEYTASWDHIDIRPGDIIAVADPNKAEARIGGRIVSANGNSGGARYTLDSVFEPTTGQSYNLMVEMPDGTVGSRPITQFTGAMVTLDGDFASVATPNAMWVITGTEVNPRQYRVISITEEEDHLFKVTALFYDPTKYARVEQGINLAAIAYYRPKTTINPPNNFTATESLYFQNGVAQSLVTLSWTPSDDFMASGYVLSATSPNGGSTNDLGTVTGTSVDINNAALGKWIFSISSRGTLGQLSVPVTIDFTVLGWGGVEPPYVSHLEVFGQGTDLNFAGKDCHVSWENNFPSTTADAGQEGSTGAGTGLLNPFYRDNVVRIYDFNTEVLMRTEVVVATDYIYTYEKNAADNVTYSRAPQRTFVVGVTVRDNLGNESAEVRIKPNNPVPDLIIPVVTSGQECMYVNYVVPTDADFAGAFIWASTDETYDPLTTAPSYQGTNNFISIPGFLDDVYYVRVAGYDQFGTTGLNISPPISVIVGGFKIDTTPPVIPTSVGATPGTTTTPTGEVISTLTVTWDASTSDNFAYFDVELRLVGGNYISFQTTTNSYMWSNLIANSTYEIRVRAFSQTAFASAFATTISVTIPPKSTAPGIPTGLTATASLKSAYLSWVNPIDPDIDHIEIWSSSTNDVSTAVLVGTSYGTAFTQAGLTTGEEIFYWVRAVNTSKNQGYVSASVSVTPGQVANGDIAADAITADKITAGTITGNLLNISTSLPSSITVGETGVTIGDPAALINYNNTTQISPGLIQISGNTTLADWRSGTDSTKIAGGSIAANSITASQVTIGMRGLTITGMQFTFDVPTQTLKWTAGTIGYVDLGAQVTKTIAAGSKLYAGSEIYVLWTKGDTALVATTTPTITGDTVTIATYTPGSGMVVTYGQTIIDGSNIVSSSIQTTQIAAGAIQAQNIAAGTITAQQIAAGSVTADKIGGGTLSAASAINIGGTYFQLNAQSQNMTVKDANGATRVVIGQLGTGNTNFGIEIYDPTGNTILTSGGLITAAMISGLSSSGNILYNSDLALGLLNFNTWDNTGVSHQFALNMSGYTLPNGSTGYLHMNGACAAGSIFDIYVRSSTDGNIPIIGGAWYESSMYVGTHRCNVDAVIWWYDAKGNEISEIHGAQLQSNYGANGGLGTYIRPFVIAQAPVNAVSCACGVRGYYEGSADPYIFFTHPYLGQASSSQTSPSNWSIGGAGAVINAANATTFIADAAINAAQIGTINANQITTNTLSAISANMGSITAGTITGPSGYMLIDCNNGQIIISDNS